MTDFLFIIVGCIRLTDKLFIDILIFYNNLFVTFFYYFLFINFGCVKLTDKLFIDILIFYNNLFVLILPYSFFNTTPTFFNEASEGKLKNESNEKSEDDSKNKGRKKYKLPFNAKVTGIIKFMVGKNRLKLEKLKTKLDLISKQLDSILWRLDDVEGRLTATQDLTWKLRDVDKDIVKIHARLTELEKKISVNVSDVLVRVFVELCSEFVTNFPSIMFSLLEISIAISLWVIYFTLPKYLGGGGKQNSKKPTASGAPKSSKGYSIIKGGRWF